MPDGTRVRELILAVDHAIRRMVYTVTEGQRLPPTGRNSRRGFEDLGDCNLAGRHRVC